jgi:2,4-dienoyl-CoA reductase-like NADH-dependent reductase (Old Yellow Enzyme family)
MESAVSALFETYTLRDMTIPNRVWMPPMCQYSAARAA